MDLLPKVMLEMIVPAGRKEEVIRTLAEAARTGKIGDGKIFVTTVEQVVRIRTGETGESAV